MYAFITFTMHVSAYHNSIIGWQKRIKESERQTNEQSNHVTFLNIFARSAYTSLSLFI